MGSIRSTLYTIGAVVFLLASYLIIYSMPVSMVGSVYVINVNNQLFGKYVTLDIHWVGYNSFNQRLFTIDEYIKYNTNCINRVSNITVWHNYSGPRFYTVLTTVNGVMRPITSGISTPIVNITITVGNYAVVNTKYAIQWFSLEVVDANSSIVIMPSSVNYTFTWMGRVVDKGEVRICR